MSVRKDIQRSVVAKRIRGASLRWEVHEELAEQAEGLTGACNREGCDSKQGGTKGMAHKVGVHRVGFSVQVVTAGSKEAAAIEVDHALAGHAVHVAHALRAARVGLPSTRHTGSQALPRELRV